jgi:CRP-like cAMP-binding protein
MRPIKGPYRATPRSFLSALGVFKNVSEPMLREMERAAVEKKFTKGETIFLEDDRADSVWFIEEGHVKEILHTAEGKNLTLSMAGRGGLFGTGSFGGGEYGCHGVAETEAKVVYFPIQAFQSFMERCPEMARAVVAQISGLLRQAKATQTFAQESAEKRILHVLLDLVGEFGNSIPMTRREVGEMAGTTVETSIRVLSKLEHAGLISGARGKIIVKNPALLSERMEGI